MWVTARFFTFDRGFVRTGLMVVTIRGIDGKAVQFAVDTQGIALPMANALVGLCSDIHADFFDQFFTPWTSQRAKEIGYRKVPVEF